MRDAWVGLCVVPKIRAAHGVKPLLAGHHSQEDFDAAAEVASKQLPDTLTNDEKLEIYALFKQAKEVGRLCPERVLRSRQDSSVRTSRQEHINGKCTQRAQGKFRYDGVRRREEKGSAGGCRELTCDPGLKWWLQRALIQ